MLKINNAQAIQGCRSQRGGEGGSGAPPHRSVNLIQTGGDRLFPSHYFPPLPDFQTFLRSCSTLLLLGDRSKFAVKTRYPINYPLLLGFKMFPGYFSKTGDKMRINQQKILSKHVIFWIRTWRICKIYLWVTKQTNPNWALKKTCFYL